MTRSAPASPPEPRDCTARAAVRETGGVTGPGGEEADIEIAVSTAGVARDGGVIPVHTWDLKSYRRNPVVLLAHGEGDAGAFPIARAEWVEPDDRAGELRSGWRFHRQSPESELAAKLYSHGFMRSASVAFKLHAWREPDPDEAEALAAELDAPEAPAWVAERAELLEVSAVSVPADPDALALNKALTTARAHGLDVAPLEDHLEKLRRRCRRGDRAACERLADRRGRGGEGETDAAETVPLTDQEYEIVTGEDGDRLLQLELGGRRYEVKLNDGESAEEMLNRVARRAAERLEERQRWRGWGDRVRP